MKIFIVIAAVVLLPAYADAYVMDKVEAVVNGKVITKSEVDKAYNVEAVKAREAGNPPSPKLRDEVLETLINRTLLLEEARKFNIAEVTDEDVRTAFERVKAGFPDEAAFTAALNKEEVTPIELRESLRDQLMVSSYVDNRIKFFVRVALEDEKEYYEQNKAGFGGRPFFEVQEEIHTLLIERETGRKLKEYLKELGSKAKIIFPGGEPAQKPVE